jgi:hypothetical protein
MKAPSPEQQEVQHDRIQGSVLRKAAPKPPAIRRITNWGIDSISVMTSVVPRAQLLDAGAL